MRHVVLAILAALAMTLGVAPARADSADEAETYYDAGEQAYRNGDFLLAAQHFEAAYEKLAAPEIAFSAAQAYRLGYQKRPKAEYVARAMELYEVYLKQVDKGPRVADASAHLENLKREWRDLVAAGKATDEKMVFDRTQISVMVPGKVKGATVRIDGKPAAVLEYVDVEPGEHTVEVAAPGYAPFQEKVKVAAGSPIAVRADLEPKPALVKIKSEGGIRVTVDGRPVTASDGVIETTAGTRYITIARRGRRPFARELVLDPGATVELIAPLKQTDQRRVARLVLLGGGVLLGATAIATTVALIANAKAEDQAQAGIVDDGDRSNYETWRGRRNTARSVSYVLGGATVFAAITALGLYVFDNPQAEAAPVISPARRDETRFTPIVLADGAGLGVTGGW